MFKKHHLKATKMSEMSKPTLKRVIKASKQKHGFYMCSAK